MSSRDLFPVRRAHTVTLLIGAVVAVLGCGGGDKGSRHPSPKLESNAQPLVTLSRSGWTATASVTGAGTAAANALDNNATTRWATGTAQAANQYFQVDMVRKAPFVGLTMDTSQTPGDYPTAFRVNVSNDGVNWGSAVATGMGSTAIVNILFPPQYARFVRVTLTGSAAANWSIHEFKVLSSSLPRTGWIATATSTEASNVASGAIDDAGGTFWTCLGAQTGQSFTVDMQGRQAFDQIILDSGSGRSNDYPRSFSVFVSNDGATWGSMVAGGNATASPVIVNLPSQFARFIKITAGTDPNSWTIGELRVNGQPTTQTKAPRTGWTATATSSSGTNTPAGALDDLTSSRWTSNGAQTGQSFTVDMLTLRTFNQITLDAGTTSTNYPRAYSVFVSSDGTTFSPSIVSGTGSAALTTITLPTQTARYIKISQTGTNSTPWSIQELNVLGPVVGRQGWVVTASSNAGTDFPPNTIDGNAATRWTTGEPQIMGQNIKIDLGVTQTFNQITLEAGTATNAPQAYSIKVSADDSTWSPPVASGAGSVTVTANFPTQTARYIKITQTGSSANPWSIQELNVVRVVQPCDTAVCAGTQCQAGTCDPSSGACSTLARADWTLCSDGNACNGLETCQQGVCTPEPLGAATTCASGTTVTFYQSFNDADTTADIGVSGSTAVGNNFALTGGLFGSALDQSVENDIHYDTYSPAANPGNITLSKPGSVSMWINPGGDAAVYFLAYSGGRKLFIVDYATSPAAVGATLEDWSTAPGSRRAQTFSNGPGGNWRSDGQWHLLVVNWGRGTLELSVDGVWSAVATDTWANVPESSWTGGVSQFLPGPYWPGAGGSSRKDELMILNRPMTHEEVAWYYAQRSSGGAGSPNPALGRFASDSTSCNAFDDLNPCTADACDAATGTISHSNVQDGTSCSDGNMCNGEETCQSGVCTQTSPALACSDACHQPGTCDPLGGCTLGAPIDKVGCNINLLQPVSVVDMRDGTFTALFGFNSDAAAPFHPTTNTVTIGGSPANPQPGPPAYLAPGNHPGVFLPTFPSGQAIVWNVDTQSVSASATSPRVTPTPFGTDGLKVTINGVDIVVKPDLGKYASPPPSPSPNPDPEPVSLNAAAFNGTIKGSLGVSPSGAATYTMPISIPPGIAGMAPNLSLVYNSQGGDGLAGQGWELSGLSYIHRCPKTRVEDGHARPIVMNAFGGAEVDSDGICLDGQRLFETAANSGVFVPEHPSFDTIQRVVDGFLVVTKSGERRWYGTTAASRVVGARGSLDPLGAPASGSEVAVWALDKVEDQWGNYYTVHYNSSDTDNGSDFIANGVLVKRIDYTGHSSGTIQTPTFNSVTFDYEPRTDVRWTRYAATRIPKKSRLSKIHTSPTQVYSLTYAAPDVTLPSRLLKIGYCSTDTSPPTCLDDLDFDWGTTSAPTWADDISHHLLFSIDSDRDDSPDNPGTMLIDLNGDGRPDFVRDTWYWLNYPGGFPGEFDPRRGTLPRAVVYTGGNGAAYSQFADLDGDGRPDLIASDKVYLNRFRTGGTFEETTSFTSRTRDFAHPTNPDRVTDVNGDGFADLILNEGGSLARGPLVIYISNGSSWLLPHDGQHFVNGQLSGSSSEYYLPYGFDFSRFDLRDLNRDGLADMVERKGQLDRGHYMAHVLTNTGSVAAGDVRPSFTLTCDPRSNCTSYQEESTTLWKAGWYEVGSGEAFPDHSRFSGDIDGDGLPDSIVYSPKAGCTVGCEGISCTCVASPLSSVDVRVELSTGNGYQADAATSYLGVLTSIAASYVGMDLKTNDPRVALADVNADGLVDLLTVSDSRVWINTGDTWVPAPSAWSPPTVPKRPMPVPISSANASGTYSLRDNGATFTDMDGDGMPELVQASRDGGQETRRTLRSGLTRLVIHKFPNSMARPTKVSYENPTTGNLLSSYKDDQDPLPGTAYVTVPLLIVSAVDEDDGVGGSAETTYSYKNLRASRYGRGLLGFQQITTVGPAKVTTTTTYSQVYPYAGLPVEIERFVQGAYKISDTKTVYCDVLEPGDRCVDGTSNEGAPSQPGPYNFVYPITVTDRNYLYDSKDGQFVNSSPIATIETTTSNRYDGSGNPTHIEIQTCEFSGTANCTASSEKYSKITDYEYGAAGSLFAQRGKVTKSIVTAQRLQPMGAVRTHIRAFHYSAPPPAAPPPGTPPSPIPPNLFVALEKEEVEPGAGEGVELDTAYSYDPFGNVKTTTVCARNFATCSYATDDPTFRKSTVTYDPAFFTPPSGSGLVTTLPYAGTPGRFPVLSQNALGHYTSFVYDTRYGTAIQTTDPNNVTTCQTFDGVGQKTSVTERCGTSPLTTSFAQFRVPAGDPGTVVTRTRLPTGVYSYVYTDARGRTVETRSRGFDGKFVKIQTIYDSLGRVHQASKPFSATASPKWTTTSYDWLSRPWNIAQDLDDIDGTGSSAASSATVEYNGPEVITTETLTRTGKATSETRVRHETKNLLGKVAMVIDAEGKSSSYEYDADSNLVKTTYPGPNVVSTVYDVHGRKTDSYDPDMGHWHYTYTAFGELASQTDPNQRALGQQTMMTYDAIGRLRTQTDGSGTAEWVYDVAISPGANIGRLTAVVSAPGAFSGSCTVPNVTMASGTRAARWYTYDEFGNVKDATECADGATFTTSFVYDGFGRPQTTTYPDLGDGTRFSLQSTYTSFGYLHYVSDPTVQNGVYWAATSMNALGQVTGEQTRNGVETVLGRNPATGWLQRTTSSSVAVGGPTIQDWTYRYDEAGNLRKRLRADQVNPVTTEETFDYDKLDRILSAETKTTGGATAYDVTETYGYDTAGLGNLTVKGGKTYSYAGCGGRPHALCSIDGAAFGYDGNGNMTSGPGRTAIYNPRNKVQSVTRQPSSSSGNDGGTVSFLYGADGNRVVQDVTNASGAMERTIYVGLGATGKSLYERTTKGASGVVEHRHFLYGGGDRGGGAFAIRVVTKSGGSTTTATKYQLFDHLGSVTAVADEAGKVVDAGSGGPNATVLGYDAWGARRNPDGTAASPSTFALQPGHREFTGQETIPNVGLVNMNGRVYDPVVGRFLSPDPNVQDATDTQSYNRYSYVKNNPLRYTDPTGYHWWDNNPIAFLSAPGLVECNDQCKMQAGITVVVTVGCIASYGTGCTAFLAWGAYANTALALENGVPWQQAVGYNLLGLAVGMVSGGIGSSVTSSLSTESYPVASAAISGAIGSAISSASMQLITRGSVSGWDVLTSAASGAAMAATTTSIQGSLRLSRASAAEAQGAGREDIGPYDEAEYQRLMAQLRGERVVGKGADTVAMELPADPSGLDSDWAPDPTHRDPNGTRVRHPSGDYLDFHKGREGARGWRGEDHWHWNGGKEHLEPGSEVLDPTPVSRDPKQTPGPTVDETPAPAPEAPPKGSVPFMPLPLPGPVLPPLPIFEPIFVPI